MSHELLIGALLGEWWKIEDRLQALGQFLEAQFVRGTADTNGEVTSNKFVRGFLTASLLFCVGPLAILGSIQDGLTGNYNLLAVKSVLDGFASLAFRVHARGGRDVLLADDFGLSGVGISLLAAQLNAVVTQSMMNEMTATGGVILIGLALSSLLEIKKIRAGNFLPALIIAPLIVWVPFALWTLNKIGRQIICRPMRCHKQLFRASGGQRLVNILLENIEGLVSINR